jgi:hypothetical protein
VSTTKPATGWIAVSAEALKRGEEAVGKIAGEDLLLFFCIFHSDI